MNTSEIKTTDIEQYHRQILLTEIGLKGQITLSSKKIVVVGIGALGTVAAELLVRAGVGKILLIDRDIVEKSNLSRQVLFTSKEVGLSKSLAAKEKLMLINPQINIESRAVHLGPDNVFLLDSYDLILDCTDNLQTRFLINDFCKKNSQNWIYAAAIKTSGYVMPFWNKANPHSNLSGSPNPASPCLKCFLKEANLDSCDIVGVINTLTTSIAALQVTLALKILLNHPVRSELFYYNIWNQEFRRLKVKPNPNCRTCLGNYDYLSEREEARWLRFCGEGKFQVLGLKVNFEAIALKWKNMIKAESNHFGLKLTRNIESITLKIGLEIHSKSEKISLFIDGRTLINASTKEKALSLYTKYIGN